MKFSLRKFVKLMLASTTLEARVGAAHPITLPGVREVSIEWQAQPLALDTLRPRFRWTMVAPPAVRGVGQSVFRLIITDEQGVMILDTRRVSGSSMAFRPQQDLLLKSQHRYRYRLEVWDLNGIGLAGTAGSFATGLLTDADRRGQWLANATDLEPRQAIEGRGEHADQATPLPMFRKHVRVARNVRHAHLCIAGLGQYQLYIDDEKISPDGLNGAWTNYHKRVRYDAYDVTAHLPAGLHRLGVALGNGFFNVEAVKGRYSKINGTFGRPQMWCQLRIVYTDGSEDILGSDSSWETTTGGTVYSSIYGGEDYDARLGDGRFGGNTWTPVTVIKGPAGKLEGSTYRPLVVLHKLSPKAAVSHAQGGIVYDFGLNHSGRPLIRFKNLQPGAVVRLLPAELLGEDGGIDQRSMVGGGKEPGYRGIAFTYIARGGDSETWSPQFTYTGYRYLQVVGAEPARIEHIASLFLSTDVPNTGAFTCSDRRMEDVHRLIRQALLSNSASVLTDCPHREKLGWLEQIYLNAATALMNSGMVRVYEKMAADMRDAQEPSGKIPTIAPEFIKFLDRNGDDTPFRDSPEWGAALILGAWAVYRLHGDPGMLEQNYDAMTRRLTFLQTRQNKDGLIDYGLGDWFDIGPDKAGAAQLTSLKMTGTGTYYAELMTLSDIARELGKPDATRFAEQAGKVRQNIVRRLFDPARSTFDTGSQTAQSMGLVLGLVPDDHRARALMVLVDDIRARRNHVSAGDIGFHYVVRALTEGGRADVLYDMLKSTDKPAYLEQVKNGATALTEAWDSWHLSSQNHFMLGHAEIWFYQGLGGLDLDFSRSTGAITLAPQVVAGIVEQAASYDSIYGRISCRLLRNGRRCRIEVDIPPGQTATVRLPRANPVNVREGRVALTNAPGIRDVRAVTGATMLSAESGHYRFSWDMT
ncbi:MAG: family 78 glycoside hydrolase catalytic domain [Massilia sp.]